MPKADIGADHMLEVGFQAAAGLAAATTHIHSKMAGRALGAEPFKKRIGVGGTKLLVVLAALKQAVSH